MGKCLSLKNYLQNKETKEALSSEVMIMSFKKVYSK